MGGGPSKEERAATHRLSELQAKQVETQNQYLQLASVPDPLTERLRNRDMAFMDWSEGKGATGPLDVTKAPGLGPSLSLYNRARQEQNEDRMGIGALRMGVQGANADLANLLKEQRGAHRERDAAGALEQAVGLRDAEVTGSILPLAALQQQKQMGLAGLTSDNAQNTLGLYARQSSAGADRPSFWKTLTQSFAQSLGGGAGSFLGGGAGVRPGSRG